jgi:hypothetical protein
MGLLDFSGPAAQHFCGILYVGDIAKFPCFCLWEPFGLWLKLSECTWDVTCILLQGS